MEAFSLSPVKASHQTAKPPGAPGATPQGPRGLGDIFATLLLEATIRLDARAADLASFETRRSDGEPPRRMSAAETISSVDSKERRDDTRWPSHSVDNGAQAAPDPIEPIAPADEYATEAYAEVTDDDEFATRAPQDDTRPSAAAAGEETPGPADGEFQLAEGEETEAPAPAPEAIAALAALPTQALPAQAQTVAAAAALGAAQALGPDGATAVALARAATRSQIPAQIPTQVPVQVPAHAAQQAQAAGRFGAEVGATRVQVTPAAVVAQPNAALGGGAAVAALAAEAGQAAAQNGAQNSQASLSNAASQMLAATTATASQNQAKPGNRSGPVAGGPVIAGQAPAGETPSTTQSATTAQNGGAMANAAQNAVTAVQAAPASGLQGQGASNPAAGEPGSPNPQNAQTAFAASNNQHAGNSGTPGGLSADAPASAAGLQNRLGQNARTDTAQSPITPVPGADEAAGTSRTPANAAQDARPATLGNSHSNTPQLSRADGSAAAAGAAQAATQNASSGSAVAGERAMAPASLQRAEGAGQASANAPTAAGTFGLTQAAARMPQALPAQARPATVPSLPANQVAVHIQRAVVAGQNRISITLHPAELGQIDVKLNIGNDGAVKAVISIERPETFELLQRDARGLEKALQDAGLKTDSGSLSFNLKGESEEDAAARREGAEPGAQQTGTETPAEPELAPEIIAAANPGGIARVLDLHV